MNEKAMYTCFALALSVILTFVIGWITKQGNEIKDEEIYSTKDLTIIDIDEKSEEVANMVSVYCPNLDFNFLREKIKSILKNEP